jgi:hypothetical protein
MTYVTTLSSIYHPVYSVSVPSTSYPLRRFISGMRLRLDGEQNEDPSRKKRRRVFTTRASARITPKDKSNTLVPCSTPFENLT